jgi:hypothetical protein
MKRILFFLIFLISLLICFGVSAQNSYEVYNYGEFTGITDIFVSDSDREYIRIKDLSKLNIEYEYLVDRGWRISVGEKSADLYHGKDAEIGNYRFENPLITVDDVEYLFLDVIGKCFSSKYKGSLKNDVWCIYLEVGDEPASEPSPEPVPSAKGLTFDNILCDYENDIFIISIKNEDNRQYNNVQVFAGFYDGGGRLIDVSLKNKYILEAAEKNYTAVIPMKGKLKNGDKVKLMLWCNGAPSVKNFIIKDFEFDREMQVPAEKEQIFSDVGTDDRYYDAIYIMNKQFGEDIIFAGYDDGSFKGEEKITRAMYAYAISKLLGMNFSKVFIEAEYPFRDMPKSEWCYREAGFAIANGFMYCENDEFLPDKNVTSNEVFFGFLAALGENVSPGDKVAKLAFERNLLENVNLEDILGSKVSKKAFIQIAYNFMMEYTKNGVIL